MKFQTLWQPAVNRHSQYITIEKQTYLRISSRLSLALVLVRFIVTSYNTAADLFSFITFYLQASSLGLGSIELNNTDLPCNHEAVSFFEWGTECSQQHHYYFVAIILMV